MAVKPNPTMMGPWTGFGLFCLYALAALGLAAVLLKKRDA
jgi:hypothetical protein